MCIEVAHVQIIKEGYFLYGPGNQKGLFMKDELTTKRILIAEMDERIKKLETQMGELIHLINFFGGETSRLSDLALKNEVQHEVNTVKGVISSRSMDHKMNFIIELLLKNGITDRCSVETLEEIIKINADEIETRYLEMGKKEEEGY